MSQCLVFFPKISKFALEFKKCILHVPIALKKMAMNIPVVLYTKNSVSIR